MQCQSDSRLLFAKVLCTNTLGDRLNLPIINSRTVVRQEFGNEKGSLNTCNTVQTAVKSADHLTVYINAPIIPLLCSPLSNQGINVTFIDMYPHLRNLPFSACGDSNMDLKIDMMIGAQFVHCFLLDQVARWEQPLRPVAILTCFGYVLSGLVQLPARDIFLSNITVSHVLKTDAMVVGKEIKLSEQVTSFQITNKSD